MQIDSGISQAARDGNEVSMTTEKSGFKRNTTNLLPICLF